MIEKILGFQFLLFVYYGAMSVHVLTGAGGPVSFVVGGIAAVMLYFGLMALFPRAILAVLVLCYAGLGFQASVYMDLSYGSAIVLCLIVGGLGWAANLEHAQAARKTQIEKAEIRAKAEYEKNPTKALLKNADAADVLGYAEQVFETRFINDAEYEAICAKVAQYSMAGAATPRPKPASAIPWRKPEAVNEDDRAAFDMLYEYSLIDALDWHSIGADMDAQIAKNAKQAAHSEHYSGVAAALDDLAGCKAITMKTYLRAMLVMDPDFPPTAAKFERLSTRVPSANARKHAKLLFQRQLIDVDEYQAAYQAIEEAGA